MLAACHEHGIKPVVIFDHFTSPRSLASRGGWEWPETARLFARYCERAVRHLGDLIAVARTINELNLPILLQQSGFLRSDEAILGARWRSAGARALGVDAKMFSSFPFCVRGRSREVLLEAHRHAAQALRAAGQSAVGMTIAMLDLQAEPGAEEIRARAMAESCDVFLEAARADDFIGVQCYTRQRIGPAGPLPPEPGAEFTQLGYEFWPDAVEATLGHAHAKAQVPIILTENGIWTMIREGSRTSKAC